MKNKKAYSAVLRLLSRKSCSEAEVRERIKHISLTEEADEIIDECKRLKYIDERGLAEHLVDKYLSKGKGYHYISALLSKRKINNDLIKEVLENFNLEREFQTAKAYFIKNKKKKKSSMLFSLKTRGFSYNTLKKIMDIYRE